ncbi:Acyltransferase [anaerobic digester metagenome]
MLRTILFFAELAFSLIGLTPKLKTARDLRKTNPRASFLYASKVAHRWVQPKLKLIGADFYVLGKENIPPEPTPCVFIGNHQSEFDFAMMLGLIDKPLGFVAKKELLRYPFLRDWMKMANCTFIDRSTPRRAMEAILEGIENVRQGYTMVIYPEGTTSSGGDMLPFKPGAFKLATKPEAIIIPVVIEGSHQLFDLSRPKRPRVWMSFLPVVETKGLTKEEMAQVPVRVETMIKNEQERLKELETTKDFQKYQDYRQEIV